jgi:hypothetical protein
MATAAAASGIQEPANDIGLSLTGDSLAITSTYEPQGGEANLAWMREDEWEIG